MYNRQQDDADSSAAAASSSASGHKRPRPTESSPDSEARCRYLRVSSLPGNCTKSELQLMFEPYGRVEECKVVRSGYHTDETSVDIGLVDMSCTREATNAKKSLDGVQLRGCPLSVSFDQDRIAGSAQQPAAATSRPAHLGSLSATFLPEGGDRPLPRLPGTLNAHVLSGAPKIPLFFVPERWLRDVHNHLVIKMRSLPWSATEDDVRQFFSPVRLPPGAVEMGRDWEGRFSGQVYVRFRSTEDAQRAMEKRSTPLGGRLVQIQRVDPNNKIFFPPGANIFSPAAARAAYERARQDRDRTEQDRIRYPGGLPSGAPAAQGNDARAMPRTAAGVASASADRPFSRRMEALDRADDRLPDGRRAEWAAGAADEEAAADEGGEAATDPGRVHVRLSVGRQRLRAAEALERCSVNEALDAVLHFLSHDARLPPATRHCASFLGAHPSRCLSATPLPRHCRAAAAPLPRYCHPSHSASSCHTHLLPPTFTAQATCEQRCCRSKTSGRAHATSTFSARRSSARACKATRCPRSSAPLTRAAATRSFGRSSSSSTRCCLRTRRRPPRRSAWKNSWVSESRSARMDCI